MASIESSSRARRRTKSLKTSPSSSTSSVNKVSKISSSKAIEVQRIITRDGFGYFSTTND